jgi:hypothetical protein
VLVYGLRLDDGTWSPVVEEFQISRQGRHRYHHRLRLLRHLTREDRQVIDLTSRPLAQVGSLTASGFPQDSQLYYHAEAMAMLTGDDGSVFLTVPIYLQPPASLPLLSPLTPAQARAILVLPSRQSIARQTGQASHQQLTPLSPPQPAAPPSPRASAPCQAVASVPVAATYYNSLILAVKLVVSLPPQSIRTA